MPRNRKKRNRRNRRRLHEKNVDTLIHDSFKYQDHKKYLKEIEQQELLVLNRTIFVSNVKDLNKYYNLSALRTFFEEQYGVVQECVVSSYGKKRNGGHSPPPPAKLIFSNVDTASIIFGKPLEEVRKGDRRDALRLIPSYAAYCRGKNAGELRVLPAEMKPSYGHARVYKKEDLLSRTFAVSSISLGHWVPEDGGLPLLQTTEVESQDVSVDFIEEFNGFKGSQITLDLRRRLLQIRVDAKNIMVMDHILGTETFSTITFRLKELQHNIDLGREDNNGNTQYSLLFNCKDPPKLHRIHINSNDYEEKDRLISIDNAPFGRCLGFKINLEQSDIHRLVSRRDEFTKKLNSFGVINSTGIEDTILISCIHTVFGDQEKKSIEDHLRNIPHTKIWLLMRSIIDKGEFCSWYDALYDTIQVQGDSLNVFQLIATIDFFKARMALELVSEMSRATRFPSQVLHELLLEEYDTDIDKVDYCVELPRLIVTPTRKVVSGLEMEMSNRVVRHFVMRGLQTTDFLRVTICDENGDKLFNDDFKSPSISAKITEILLNGVVLDRNTYKFLAYSSSQLKECSVWMVNCLSKQNMVQTIRTWMGDFSDIKIPSKYAARMGQCFSTTIQTLQGSVEGSKDGYLRVNDKTADIISKVNTKESCHSDGTGLIRKEAMKEILKNIPFGNIEDVSIIQIRFGGAKGTLTAWDNLRALENYDVCLRESMVKFPSPYRHLEVIKVGKHVPYYLNRQMIMLLDVHKVPPSAFLTMQTAMLNELDNMLSNRKIAAEILPQLSVPDSSIKASLIHMLRSGFSPLSDPFLFSCLHAIRSHHLINLKKKSRIFVKKGAVLLGGLDETGIVPEGCVFIKVRNHGSNSQLSSIIGPVLVAKHPVTHPGDVRMLLAVDVPQLQAHSNVILFSQHGKRSEADKMSGSDLDGDEFAVTWDNRLFLKSWNGCTSLEDGTFKTKLGRKMTATKNNTSDLESANCRAMDFDTQQKADHVDTILDEHLVEHFVNFAKADTLGRISMLWLDYAAIEGSAACSQCLELANLHSIAVDYPKSGVPAIIPRELAMPSGKARPHWRERKGESYHCESTIGKLYDEIVKRSTKDEEMERHSAVAGRRFNKQGQLLCFKDRKTRTSEDIFKTDVVEKLELFKQPFEGVEDDGNLRQASECILFAIKQRELYEDELILLMNKYRVHSEGELLTGCISKYHRLNKRRRFDLAEEVRIQCKQLRDRFREEFLTKVVNHVLPQSVIHDSGMEHFVTYAHLAASSDRNKLAIKIDQLYKEEGCTHSVSHEDVLSMRNFAQKLAAAYYLVTYNLQMSKFGYEDEEVVNEDSVIGLYFKSLFQDSDDIFKDLKEKGDSHSLYSFPHLVFDVIAAGLCEHVEA